MLGGNEGVEARHLTVVWKGVALGVLPCVHCGCHPLFVGIVQLRVAQDAFHNFQDEVLGAELIFQ